MTAPSRGFLLNSPENSPFFFFWPLSGVAGGFESEPLRVDDGAADTLVPPPSRSTDRSCVLCVTSTSSELYCVRGKKVTPGRGQCGWDGLRSKSAMSIGAPIKINTNVPQS